MRAKRVSSVRDFFPRGPFESRLEVFFARVGEKRAGWGLRKSLSAGGGFYSFCAYSSLKSLGVVLGGGKDFSHSCGSLSLSLHVARFGQAFFGDGSRFGVREVAPRSSHSPRMASNSLPSTRDMLFALGDGVCDGLHAHEVGIGIKQNTEAVVRPALTAARAAENAYGAVQVAKKGANSTLTTADAAARVFITNAKKRLSKFFGDTYSTEWGSAGWPNNSIAMPTTQDERFSLVESLKLYLTANPAQESVDMDVTAAIAAATFTALSDARAALAQKVTENGQAKATRDNAEDNLRKRLTGVITELQTLIADDDPLWHAFGLNAPGDPETPEAPTFTTLLPGAPGSALADWDDALRADHYRVWIFVVGVDTAFRAVVSPSDSDATIGGLTSGSTVKVHVTSVNAAGESAPGPEAQIVVP